MDGVWDVGWDVGCWMRRWKMDAGLWRMITRKPKT